jgi:AcrR family transcriptional regulator
MPLASRRSELVGKARALLAEVGSEALTMRRLGEAAGMQAPSLYKHFAGKPELERQLAATGWAELAGLLRAWAAERGADLERIERGYRRFVTENPGLYRLMAAFVTAADAAAIEAALGPPAARQAFERLHGAALLQIAGA